MADVMERTPLITDANDANGGYQSGKSDTSGLGTDDDDDLTSYHSQGSLDKPSRSHCIRVAACILIMELCERLTFYSVTGNLVLFCTSVLNMGDETASSVALAFTGVCYFIPIFGGYIADAIAGKYNTIYGSGMFYVVGTFLLPTVAKQYDHKYMPQTFQYLYFGIALFMISCGTGGIKSNISPFGAEQVQSLGEGAIRSFFNWFYWFINIGSFVAFSLVVWIQQKYGFFDGLIPPFVTVLLSILVFVSGRNDYICRPPQGSVMTDIFKVLFHAISRRFKHKRDVLSLLPKGVKVNLLDYARISYGGKYSNKQVNTVVCLKRILIIFATIIFYWTVYFQMQTSYLIQGECMNLNIGSFVVPAASLSLIDSTIILLLIPLMDRIVYPFLLRRGIILTQLRRIGIGMIFAICSVIAAGILEIQRRNTLHGRVNKINGDKFNASELTVFYQIPQFLFIGASEVFTSISGLEFAYVQAPKYLQGVIMGLFLATSGFGAFIGSGLVKLVSYVSSKYGHNWYPSDINKGRLEYFFFLLAAIMFLDFLIFLLLSWRYSYIDSVRDLGEEAFVSPPRSRRNSRHSQYNNVEDELSVPDVRASSPKPGDASVADGRI